ncbi:MAG: radical SAM protein [Candidatus Aminicenantes bacterium]|nr:radical SAM protein [Candidatus Aminicenantes bacterium]
MTEKLFPHLYGPVPSRRLGYSLGVDLLPFKTCSLSCIYCQLGRTKKTTIRRKKYFSERQILQELKDFLKSGVRVDFITFSGSGEPTLNSSIGQLIRKIKKMTGKPVAVLTNSTLLTRPAVRKDLEAADVVVPSLDAADQKTFKKINRPHPTLKASKIIDGLIKFRKQFKGQIWLEILLVKGLNDSPGHLKKLKAAADKIKPDRIHLNTVVRPPAEKWARPLAPDELERVRLFFGPRAEVVASFHKKEKEQEKAPEDLTRAILSIVKRRPVNLEDLQHALGQTKDNLFPVVQQLIASKKIKEAVHRGLVYYESA